MVLPTDTVYGLAADAFDKDSVQELLDAKGRGRDMPPPVLVSAATTLDALAVRVPTWARALVEEFWPGALTLVCHAHASLQWDLGDTRGTVAVRMPDHPVALEILERTGPLAVSSANLTGRPAATEADRGRGDAGRGRRGGGGRRYVAGRRGLDHRRRHRHPRPGAAARRASASTSSTRCSSRSATPSPTRTRPRRTPRTQMSPRTPTREGVHPRLPGGRRGHLPAHGRGQGDRDPRRRGREGPRPRRARRAHPLPRRAGDAGRPRGGVLRRPRAALPLGELAAGVPGRRDRADRGGADLRGRGAGRPLRARCADQAGRPGARGRLPGGLRHPVRLLLRRAGQPVLRSTPPRARCSPGCWSWPPSTRSTWSTAWTGWPRASSASRRSPSSSSATA